MALAETVPGPWIGIGRRRARLGSNLPAVGAAPQLGTVVSSAARLLLHTLCTAELLSRGPEALATQPYVSGS